MAINFPASPSTDDTYTENYISWIFNGTSWNALDEPTTASDLGLGNVDNTSDASKPVSTAQAAADAVVLAAAVQRANHTGTQTLATISDAGTAAASATGDFAPIAHATDTANPHSVTATQVGLGNVDNTSDASKPVSTAQASADAVVLAAAVQRANHTGTQTLSTISDAGTAAAAATGDFTPIAHATDTANPHAVTKTQVGLGSVDNTSDASKPVSTAQQTADDLKLDRVRFAKVVFEGDSLTSSSGPASPDTWPAFFATLDEVTGSTFVNVAASSETVAQMLTSYSSQIEIHKPLAGQDSLLALWGGYNDINTSRSASDIYDDLKDIWALAKADGFKVCAFTVASANHTSSAPKGAVRITLNDLIRSDKALYDYLVEPDRVVHYISDAKADALHFDADGNLAISDLVRDTVFYGGSKIERTTNITIDAREASYSRQLPINNRVLAGTGAVGAGTILADGRTGGWWSAGDATSSVYAAGPSTVLGIAGAGQSITWSQEFVLYARFEAGTLTNSAVRLVLGLRTDIPSDIATQSGSFAGIEFRSNGTTAHIFSANATTPTVAAVTSPTWSAMNHVWLHNRGGGSGKVDIYHQSGSHRARMPSSPIGTVSAAPTGIAGSGCSLQLVGTAGSASASANFYEFKLFL